jgi:uncharacterized membrane protein HdeD (DUF308 family)
MSLIKSKYIDSHWLIFFVQGLAGLALGAFTLFAHPTINLSYLLSIVGTFLLFLGIIEVFNVLNRERRQSTWVLNIVIAIVDVAVAMALLLTLDQPAIWHLSLLAGYTLARGLFEVLVGIRSVDDRTDRFIWVLCGICGVIMGFVVFNAGAISTLAFVRFFGAYMMVFGLSNLIYSIHNRDQKLENIAERASNAKKSHKKKGAKK